MYIFSIRLGGGGNNKGVEVTLLGGGNNLGGGGNNKEVEVTLLGGGNNLGWRLQYGGWR